MWLDERQCSNKLHYVHWKASVVEPFHSSCPSMNVRLFSAACGGSKICWRISDLLALAGCGGKRPDAWFHGLLGTWLRDFSGSVGSNSEQHIYHSKVEHVDRRKSQTSLHTNTSLTIWFAEPLWHGRVQQHAQAWIPLQTLGRHVSPLFAKHVLV